MTGVCGVQHRVLAEKSGWRAGYRYGEVKRRGSFSPRLRWSCEST